MLHLPRWRIIAEMRDLLAGAKIPGRKARYLRLELKSAKPETLHLRQVEVCGRSKKSAMHTRSTRTKAHPNKITRALDSISPYVILDSLFWNEGI